jgi:hypothetical protein
MAFINLLNQTSNYITLLGCPAQPATSLIGGQGWNRTSDLASFDVTRSPAELPDHGLYYFQRTG